MTNQNRESRNKDTADDKTQQRKKQDDVLWKAMTEDVEPLKTKNTVYKGKEKPRPKQPSAPAAPPETETIPIKADISIKKVTDANVDNPAGIDRRTQQRLKRGKMPIDGRLDLHGKTQNEAYDALLKYIPAAQISGKRCILVITGKGQPRYGDPSLLECSEHIGVLKQKTPYWLSTPPLNKYVLDIQPARPNHGGEGALYVLLRRKRKNRAES